MKTGRKKAALLAGLFLLFLLLIPPVPVRADGPVTAIGTPEQLTAFAESVRAGSTYAGRTVTLTADIDMTGWDFTAIGVWNGEDHSRVFQGTFDGDGHAVTGLTVAAAPGSAAVGFFSGLYNASVKNLTLQATVAANGVPFAGGLAGAAVDSSFSWVAADVYLTAAAWPVPEDGALAAGGLVGLADGRTVMDRCAVRGHVGAAGSFAGSVYAGGLIGLLRSGGSDGRVSNCYSTAGMYVNDRAVYVGGLLGGALGAGGYTTVQNCYAAAGMLIAGDDMAGGFAGTIDGSVVLQNVWYDADLAADLPNGGNAPAAGLAGAPTEQMQNLGFPAVLGDAFAPDRLGVNGGYPVLAFEAPPEPTAAPEPTASPEPTTAPVIPTDTPAPTTVPAVPTSEPFPTAAPAPTDSPAPTTAPVVPTSEPFPTAEPAPTDTPAPTTVPVVPTSPPFPTAGPTAPPAVTSPPMITPAPAPFAPRTGDSTVILPWLVILGLGGMALTWLARRRFRK